jgi:uncharacterized protein YjiS (DUF1127 family)
MSRSLQLRRGVASLPTVLIAALVVWTRRRGTRLGTARHLDAANEHMLRDIGLTRYDLDHPPRRGSGRRGP